MNNSAPTTLKNWLLGLLPSALLLLVSAGPAPAQAAKPQTSPAKPADVSARVTESLIDAATPDDADVQKMVAVYAPKVRELDTVIGNLKGELRKGGTGAGSLGNFVTDGMRWQAAIKSGKTIDIAVMNSGGMRRQTIGEGELRARDIFELLPFENALITVELTGDQLKTLLTTVLTSGEAQSGAKIVYKQNAEKKNEAQSIKLRTVHGEREIDPAGTYIVVTIDYLYNVGGPRYGILKEGKNMKALGITLRESLMNYVKSETAAGRNVRPNLDGRFWMDRTNQAAPANPTNPAKP